MVEDKKFEERRIDFTEGERARVVTLEKGTTLHRLIGVAQLFAIGYSDVGSSIYYALGITALYALGATPLALALAGIVFFCTVLTYAEMAAALPEAGGSATFARHAFNDLVSFVAGWALLLDYVVTISISVYTVGPYLSYFFPILKTPLGNIPFSLAVLSILFLLNVVGIRESTRVSILLCAFDILTQVSIILIGAVFLLNLPHVISHLRIGVLQMDWSPTWPQFWKGVGMAMVAYIGIESISQLSSETQDPGKKLPRAMLITMVTLFFMYFGISTVALSAMHPRVLSTTYLEDPLAGIAAALPVGREFFGPWIGILGATILFVAANAGLIGASRLTFSMGEHYQLPRFFYRLHHRFKTPHIALLFFTGIAAAIIFVARRLTFIADLYNFGAMLAFFLAHLSLLGLRIRQPDLPRPFRAPFNIPVGRWRLPLTAMVGLLGTFAVWVDVILTKPAGRYLGFLWIGLGLAFYFKYRQTQKIPAAERVEIEKVEIPGFERVQVRKILVPTLGFGNMESVQYACQLAKQTDAEVTALYVIEIPASLPLDTFFPEKLIAGDHALDRVQAIGREFGLKVETQVLQARSAGETIVEEARLGNFDLIVLGALARGTGFGLTSTIDFVLRNAPCQVWICRASVPPAHAKALPPTPEKKPAP